MTTRELAKIIAIPLAAYNIPEKGYLVFIDMVEAVISEALKEERAKVWEEAAKIASALCWKDHGDDDCLYITDKLRQLAEEERR